jgi:predicted GNAT family N-acyltransferase
MVKTEWAIWSPETLPTQWKSAVLKAMATEWPIGFTGELEGRDWIHPEDAQPRHLILWSGEEWIGHASIMHQHRIWNNQNVHLNGLSGVIIHPNWRSQGWGAQLMDLCDQALLAEDADISCLCCEAETQIFYHRWGFKALDAQILKGDPQAPEKENEPLMVKLHSELGRQWAQAHQQQEIYFGPYTW